MQKISITHHSLLKQSGGAVRVAHLLNNGLNSSGHDSVLSWEVDEKHSQNIIPPQSAARSIGPERLIHLHSSHNTSEFIESLHPESRLIVTMHDLKMVTGGCPYPLDCPEFMKGCKDPCPRNFPNSESVRRRSIETLLKRNVILISPSGWLAKEVKKTEPLLSPQVIPNGIHWTDKEPDKKKARERLGIHPASRVVLFVAHGGVTAQYKAGHRWMHMWQTIKKNVPEAIGFVCGGKDFKVEGDLHFWPYVGREKLGQLMEAADILAYPTYADNHPLIVLEAMSHGLACLSYNTGGVPEQIINGETGVLVDYKNEGKFIDEAVQLLKMPGKCRSLGLRAFSDGKTKFKVQRMLSSYLKRYRRLI